MEHRTSQGTRHGRLGLLAVVVLLWAGQEMRGHAGVYFVDQQSASASDANSGSNKAPWKTLGRAARARELRPGDQVLIRGGVYREHVQIQTSGKPDRPITFAAAPGARVVVKGSEVVRGPWVKLTTWPGAQPAPLDTGADIWTTQLGEAFFTDPVFQARYRDRTQRWISQVFRNDTLALQRIGPDPIYRNEPSFRLTTVGEGLADMVQDSFWFDPTNHVLYVRMGGHPEWNSMEVGVRGFVLTGRNIHDVVIRGLEMRHNRQPAAQWSMVSFEDCERVVLEGCRIYQADFAGLALGRSTNCVLRNCDLSYNGNTGLGMGECLDCLVEDCTLLFNNTRRFEGEWHAGGMKGIPSNRRCTVQRCEVAYNVASPGIWFDSGNSDIRLLDNICHHNGGAGIFFEINPGGGLIADNLVFANRGRGIYISGSQNTWVVHNTVAGNHFGIVCMPRGPTWPVRNVRILNNLFLDNTIAADNHARGADLTLFMGSPADGSYYRTVPGNYSDHNVFGSAGAGPVLRHDWNPDNTLAQWQQRFGEDRHSRLRPVLFDLQGAGFRLRTASDLEMATPLPDNLGWHPPQTNRVGSSRLRWPQ